MYPKIKDMPWIMFFGGKKPKVATFLEISIYQNICTGLIE